MASLSSSSSPNPKYPYPSEVKVTDFVRIKLSPTNYFTWRHQMFGFIGSKGLLGFINVHTPAQPEKITVPDDDSSRTEEGRKEMKNKDYEDWERSDSLVLSWITDTINYELFPKNVVRQNTAVDMWSELEYQLLPSLGSRQGNN
uniref:Retrotransposon Copia-like N-terminal domain-containing protein n=1 Tax=Davidia involucrata TaxID=16924 RepID=A0A5B7AXP1_DAVIN